MARQSKFQELQIEKQELITLYKEHGSLRKVAKALGVSQSTVSMACLKWGLEVQQVLVEKEKE